MESGLTYLRATSKKVLYALRKVPFYLRSEPVKIISSSACFYPMALSFIF